MVTVAVNPNAAGVVNPNAVGAVNPNAAGAVNPNGAAFDDTLSLYGEERLDRH